MSIDGAQITYQPEILLSLLLQQPTEIITAVLRWLEVKDLLNLRVSCRQLHMLLHALEQSFCAAYCGQLKQEYAGLRLLASIHEDKTDLMSYIELQHRHSGIWALSGVLSKHVLSKLNFQVTAEKATLTDLRVRKSGRLQKALFPYLFMLNNFLESLRQVIVEADEAFAEWDDDIYMSANDVFLLDQQHLVKVLCDSTASILGISAAHSILVGVCTARSVGIKIRPSSYPFATVKRIMLTRGLLPFAALLADDQDDAARRIALNRASESVLPESVGQLYQPGLHGNALKTIHHLDISRSYVPEPRRHRPYRVTNKFLDRQNVWDKAAFAVLRRVYDPEIDQQSEDADEWVLRAIAEPSDVAYSLADWRVS